jgi:hypothetical protein
MLSRDRHGHLPLADGPHGAAGQRCPVMVNRIGLRRARRRQLIGAKSFRGAFRRRNMGNRVRCCIYRVGAPRRESAYDAEQRNRCGLADDAQHDHPLSTLPASGDDTAFRSGPLRYCRPRVTLFLLTGGKRDRSWLNSDGTVASGPPRGGCAPHHAPLAGPVGGSRVIVGRRAALLCGHGRVEPHKPHGVCFIEFGNGFS